MFSESQGPVWLIGTGKWRPADFASRTIAHADIRSASEHHINYQYFLKNAKDHYLGLAQTETVGGVVSA